MSRLEYAPKLKEIEITDIKAGAATFVPRPEKRVSFAALKNALKRAGYTLASAEVTIAGTLRREGDAWLIVADDTAQSFSLEGASLKRVLAGAEETGARVELTGDWKTAGEAGAAREVVTPSASKRLEALRTGMTRQSIAPGSFNSPPVRHAQVQSLAPIRTTSPGLTVFQGGAIAPRLSFTRQHLGGLKVRRQTLNLSATYTPSPRLQLETEVALSRTSYDDGVKRGSGVGVGNATLWGKYRFYRTVERWGDRQAAVRVGVELPTGKKGAPGETELNAPLFVRQQLSGIGGGAAVHVDAAYSQARGRVIFGGNVAGVMRSERAGYHAGHELQVNTDLEYVVFPFKYRKPTGEIFAILETNFIRRGAGHAGGREVAESRSTEFYLSPALQYVAGPRIVLEGSLQLPVIRRAGAQVLRTDGNLLLGVRYLF